MTILFVDSTYDITLGLLDDNFSWLSFQSFTGKKASTILQKEAFLLLKAHSLKAVDLKAVISVAGPGFYTGLRLAEGLADVFQFFSVPHYSIYSYMIPKLCGFQEGSWLTKAYRGEFFFHHWNSEHENNVLIQTKELEAKLAEVKELFIHTESAMDESSLSLISEFQTTYNLLKKFPQGVFKNILAAGVRQESYYFRAPEDEFRVSL